MKKVKTGTREPDMRIAVVLEPDVAERFPDAKAVNEALHALAALADRKVKRHAGRRAAVKSVRGSTRG